MTQFKLTQEAMTRALSARGNSLDLERQIMAALSYEIEQGNLLVPGQMLELTVDEIASIDAARVQLMQAFFEEPGPAMSMSWGTPVIPAPGPYAVTIEELGDGLEDFVVVREDEIYYSSADRQEAEAVCEALNRYNRTK